MDTNRVPQPRHHDDSVVVHYACMDGWVFVGRVVESEHDLWGKAKPTLTFADNGGRHPRVPHAPPGSYHSPCRLFSRPMAARTPGVSLKDTAMDINNV
jgi:hypothetical protein